MSYSVFDTYRPGKFMFRSIKNSLLFTLALTLLALPGLAQETQTRVIDEVVAQVNDGVITLSRVRREMQEVIESYVAEGKSRAEAQRLVEEKQGELIAQLINEELLMQKGKEINLDSEIEAMINQRFVEIMKQYNMTTVDALYAEMERGGNDPRALREGWRRQLTRERVIQREVDAKIYWDASAKQLRDYFEANKSKFTRPETISFSELFLGFAGRDERAVKEKAERLVREIRAGAAWDQVVKDNGDTPVVTDGKGKAEDLVTKDIVEIISKPLEGLKPGDITAPIVIDDMGVVILRVDARKAASSESFFDENAVRMAITSEKAPNERKKFMSKLRGDAYIKISDTYRPIVSPILFADERTDKPSGR